MRIRLLNSLGLAAFVVLFTALPVSAGDLGREANPNGWGLGYDLLIGEAFVPSQLDQEVFENLWRTWEEPARSEAKKAGPAERRRLTLARYGLDEAPGREGGVPMQYADNGQGGWANNCLMCHGGKVGGKLIPGLPNTHIMITDLFADTVKAKQLLGREVPAVEIGGLLVPLGGSQGTTNAIIFGVVLGSMRDPDLTVHTDRPLPKLVHNDHDAPPWWHVKRKQYLYADGFAPKGHRALMQFMMAPSNGPEEFHAAEPAFEEIYDWILSLEVPKYPFDIDHELAAKGKDLFNQTCSECHGTYGDGTQFPNMIVPLEVVGTDPARWESLTYAMRFGYQLSWFAHNGEKKVIADTDGYVAQPLDGIWATAPYLHNGSVPTLWHLFHPEDRPVVWKRATPDGYDQERVGLDVVELNDVPDDVDSGHEKRLYFDTRKFAKSAQGHLFPDQLTEEEKVAVMEYLKTL